MKEFEIEFSETIWFKTIIEAETIEEARKLFLDGEFYDCEEVGREFNGMTSIDGV